MCVCVKEKERECTCVVYEKDEDVHIATERRKIIVCVLIEEDGCMEGNESVCVTVEEKEDVCIRKVSVLCRIKDVHIATERRN